MTASSGDPVPRWFSEAVAQEHRPGEVTVDEARIHTRAWGAPGDPGVVLVHGGAAHSGWWDHVAPLVAQGRHVVALDLSGHGDSDHRETYGMSTWAREVVAVADAAGMDRPVVVGHSMGGWVSVTAGVEHAERVAGLAVLDSPLFEQPPEEERLARRRRPTRVYPTREQALGRFATIPAQDVVLPYVRERVAAQSLRAVEGGWTWKFDPAMFGSRAPLRELLPRLTCPAALFRSQHGLVPPEMGEVLQGLLGPQTPVVELPDTGHHPMLDQPLVLVAALRTLLTSWEAAG